MGAGGPLIERHYTTQELAELLSVNAETVRRAAASGALRSVRVGRVRRYAHSAVVEWLSVETEGRAA
jgi:excisionase family DNA binding protein